ncbi:hypothetical protein GLOIN_2v1557071 [Rhizophagus irregularis DAOM 181602=DAOM 197198]|uniref:Uncharacterized protein n=1 Tax=Rhizophagus irregularis (strain DAOM 181602 / DAOM 197198 / MUCL 43194) TaxID=747089 RepID=A0A2P4QFB4_RHIID|nr:hypothetical protein GLOIN_2v1557071 [Rhizophagus irregularis DAOM 181602=DAOM 197198]POG76332.1 hypothetical protein GLOIN_2v1557071 [Rhizophagus irregularis DAOM 181602=DAOM 197198]|eukprot:XP_025183198.1 hypothetical protein GLOIN_2v1557071 [Rhizophagus irregularis DAOM 181602=DAOM 197198]
MLTKQFIGIERLQKMELERQKINYLVFYHTIKGLYNNFIAIEKLQQKVELRDKL